MAKKFAKKFLMASVAAVCMGLAAVAAQAKPAAVVTVDALNNCLDLEGQSVSGIATTWLPAGTYRVKISANTSLQCAAGCNTFDNVSVVVDLKSAVLTPTKPITITLGAQGGRVDAYVVDTQCWDNTGSLSLSVTKLKL